MNRQQFKYIFLAFSAICLLIFLTIFLAGRLSFWQGWLFGGLNFILILLLFIRFPELTGVIRERMRPGEGTKWWDKIFWMIYGPMNLAIIVVACLDAGRYLWSINFAVYIYVLAYIIYIFANYLHLWAIITNDFYTSTVRIQEEQKHHVIDTGPYKFVRHPGYLGISLMLFCMSIVLGSLWGLVPFSLVFILLIMRTYLEDKTLQEELPGYKEYIKKTPYRLIPGIW